MRSGYAMRVGIGGHCSSLKRIFGDEVGSRNPRCAEHEIQLEVAIYNDMIDLAVSDGHTGKRILLPGGRGGGGTRAEYQAGPGRRGVPGGRTGRRPSGGRGAGAGRRGGGGGQRGRRGRRGTGRDQDRIRMKPLGRTAPVGCLIGSR